MELLFTSFFHLICKYLINISNRGYWSGFDLESDGDINLLESQDPVGFGPISAVWTLVVPHPPVK